MPSAWFYASKDHGRLNGKPFFPEAACGRLMANPLYQNLLDFSDLSQDPNSKVGNQLAEFRRIYKKQPSWSIAEICETMKIPPRSRPILPGTLVGDDSGAFQEWREDPDRDGPETRSGYRRTPAQALDRQLAHQARLQRDCADPDFFFEFIVTYDQLQGVDEGTRINPETGLAEQVKLRGTEATGEAAVRATIASAEHYAKERHQVQGAVAYSSQGVTLTQYLRCTEAILDLMLPEDWYAFGGFCIIGKQPSLKPQFAATIRAVAPKLKAKGVTRVHLLGVCAHDCIQVAVDEFRKFGIVVSTDGSGPETNSINGRIWDIDYTSVSKHGSPWRQAFSKEQKKAPGGYHPADLSIENIRRYATWMESLGLDQPPHDDRLERITEGMEKLELFFASFGPDRRRRAAFSPASAARFVDQEVRRRQLSMWD